MIKWPFGQLFAPLFWHKKFGELCAAPFHRDLWIVYQYFLVKKFSTVVLNYLYIWDINPSFDLLPFTNCFNFFCRGEALSLFLGRLWVAFCPFRRTDTTSPQTHWSKTFQMCALWKKLFKIRPPCSPHEATSVNTVIDKREKTTTQWSKNV
jgi:hypothetical protein